MTLDLAQELELTKEMLKNLENDFRRLERFCHLDTEYFSVHKIARLNNMFEHELETTVLRETAEVVTEVEGSKTIPTYYVDGELYVFHRIVWKLTYPDLKTP